LLVAAVLVANVLVVVAILIGRRAGSGACCVHPALRWASPQSPRAISFLCTDAVDRTAHLRVQVTPGREEVRTMLKKVLLLLVVGFAAFYLLTRPEGAANAVEDAAGAVIEAFEAIARFFTSLVS